MSDKTPQEFEGDDTQVIEENTQESDKDLPFYRLVKGAAYVLEHIEDYLDSLADLDIEPEIQASIKTQIQQLCQALEMGMNDPEALEVLLKFSDASNKLLELSEDAMIAIEEANNA